MGKLLAITGTGGRRLARYPGLFWWSTAINLPGADGGSAHRGGTREACDTARFPCGGRVGHGCAGSTIARGADGRQDVGGRPARAGTSEWAACKWPGRAGSRIVKATRPGEGGVSRPMGWLADRQCYPASVALGMVPPDNFVEPPVRIDVAAGPQRHGVETVHGGARGVVRMGAVAERVSLRGATCTVPHILTRSSRADESQMTTGQRIIPCVALPRRLAGCCWSSRLPRPCVPWRPTAGGKGPESGVPSLPTWVGHLL